MSDPDETGWHDLIAIERIEKAWVTPVSLGTRRLAVHDTPTGIHVTAALCSHAGADLCDGWFDGHVIECPLHQGAFDVRDSRPVSAPATRPLRTYPARVSAGMVQIRLQAGPPAGVVPFIVAEIPRGPGQRPGAARLTPPGYRAARPSSRRNSSDSPKQSRK